MARYKVTKENWENLGKVFDQLVELACRQYNAVPDEVSLYQLEDLTGLSHETLRRYQRGVAFPDRRQSVSMLVAPLNRSYEDAVYFFATGKWPQSTEPTKESLVEYLSSLSEVERWQIMQQAAKKQAENLAA